ncbi:unnamed protein product [Darwinula stevensoni]|uniref:Ubiquitin-conjugating enzyme E2 S n=1 Tax=Darwinula stevensoni TaxID=69355 RepID=A0A7R9A7E7_9CRUS|nr:unnamed protein product [Darwinula stevensoni]CAG0893004.1 unnamed protein product [Darwinula stevensoni]
MQSMSVPAAYADALQRARQIAAKIQPNADRKRPLEDGGGDPESKKMAALNDPFGAQLAAMRQSGGSVINEDIKVPDHMVGLIIGRGGEQVTRLQCESGAKVQMAADSGGGDERTCTLTGTREAINRAKDMIQKIISTRSGGPNDTVPSGMLGGGGGGGGSGGGGGGGGMRGPGMMGGNSANHTVMTLMIPGPKVGLVVGKGGSTIKQMEERIGVKMVIVQESAAQEGDKPLRISGDPQKCEQAKQAVMELIGDSPGGFGSRGGNSFGPDGPLVEPIAVPQPAVGVIIGKGGEMIKKIQNESGAKVQFTQARGPNPNEQICQVSGKPDQVAEARRVIMELIDSVMTRDGAMGRGRGRSFDGGPPGPQGPGGWGERGPSGQGWNGGAGGANEVLLPVPANKCGLVIGKGGETIKGINQQTGAHCELDRRPPPNPNEKVFVIRGTPDQIEHAKQLIFEKVGGGQPDYSQQWIEYYRSVGMHQQADLIEQQTKARAAAGAQAPSQPMPGTAQVGGDKTADGKVDYSQQWIEYYRAQGMHKEADMIEQQAKARQAAGAGGAPNAAQSYGQFNAQSFYAAGTNINSILKGGRQSMGPALMQNPGDAEEEFRLRATVQMSVNSFASSSNVENVCPQVLRQVAKEIGELVKNPPEGIRPLPSEQDITDIQALITGPPGTPYAGGVFRVRLILGKDFPQAPPKGFFVTKIFHPNVARNGEICVNTLKKDWKPDLGLKHIFLTVKCLLIVPNPESALNEEAGKLLLEDYNAYCEQARMMAEIHARPPRGMKLDGEDLCAPDSDAPVSKKMALSENKRMKDKKRRVLRHTTVYYYSPGALQP